MKRRILSIDGGGIKGIFAARFLAQIEKDNGVQICDYFDIIAGTSTGAIIAAALAIGIPAKEIVDLYDKNGETIFKEYKLNSNVKAIGNFKTIFYSRYDNKELKKCLQNIFKNKLLGDSRTRLLIPAVNLDTGGVEVFKTAHNAEFKNDYREKIVDILLSTTAAPTYFPAYDFKGRGRFIDGGVGANNPSNIAIIEALTRCQWDKESLYVLSIGYSDSKEPVLRDIELNGVHAKDIINTFMNAESQYSNHISRFLIGNDHFIRIVPEKSLSAFDMDNASENIRTTLKNLAAYSYRIHITKINETFFNANDGKKQEFIPEYSVNKTEEEIIKKTTCR